MKENSVYDDSYSDDSRIKTILTNETNKLNTTNSYSSENQNININKAKKKKIKVNNKNQNSILSDLQDFDSRSGSIVSYSQVEDTNRAMSFDCTLGPDIVPDELRKEIMKFNPDEVIPPLMNKRTHFFKEIPYIEILKLEKNELNKPLLKMEDPLDIDTAKQMFRNLISYMKLRKSSKEPIKHAKKLLRIVRQANPILKDEAYLQVYKQLHNNHEYQSFMAAYKMLGILASCFVPNNRDVFLFILKYLYDEMTENKNILVLNHIKYIFNRMMKTNEHERKNANSSNI